MARGHGRSRRGHGAEHDNDERWLLTYADMITLLMALFMVLFSISSVNISKYRTLQMALKAAFSGDILPGGKSIEQPGASANSSRAPTTIDTPAIVRLTPNVTSELEHVAGGQSGSAQASAQSAATSAASVQVSAAQQEQASFEALAARAQRIRRQARVREVRPRHDRTARPGDPGAHRQPPLQLRQRHPGEPGRSPCSPRSRRC